MNKRFKTFIVVLLIISSFVLLWANTNNQNDIEKLYLEKFQNPIYSVLYYISNIYYEKDKVDYDKVLDSTLKGLVEGLNDPFAWYLDSQQVTESKIEESGEYGGLGILVSYDSKLEAIRIISPMIGTPAYEAGLQADDLIISVDGSPVSEIGYIGAVNKMRGKPGTSVQIEIFREGWEESKKITIIREKIETVTAKYKIFDSNNFKIGYIKLTNFAEKSASEMHKALKAIEKENVNGIILDLRNNPGGFLNVAIDIASMFIKDKTIVTVRYFDGSEEVIKPKTYEHFDFIDKLPIVLLVNKSSASASEILTGALKDNKIATVIGKTTYGKAAVQRPIPLENGGEVWLPIGHYFTPNGNDIHLKGIKPDIIIDNPQKEVKNVEQMEAKNTTTFEAIIDLENDLQLLKSIEVLKMGGK
ncbi:carboxyl-terminal processing protease [Marinitoga hydrogenitolerans DSM 16785]|uniref:Carboxyl-terminal processing protease n=1 Tax=Marinitoga hydrogenitolerans (strain DSM 16785 / JCM 12826 / AT1271) TaxID=1122195 RepID=A0A1M4VZQ8_MARH1|nr:S41 family peptidase [Marinitoga hydrogenitolerans]SHE74468.1 carboxyl-terminal processing protease [Marinitoga hydrogenitolerans DSM 16785]